MNQMCDAYNFTLIVKDAAMFDVRVQSRGPDDIVFDQNSDIRAKIARGNCILKQGDQYELIIYALRKFTGGLGKLFKIQFYAYF